MKALVTACLLLFSLASAFIPAAVLAESENLKTLIVYKGEADEWINELHVLDLAVGHFTPDMTIVPMAEAMGIGTDTYTHVIYLGFDEEPPAERELAFLDAYDGPLFLIGNHIEQFPFLHDLQVQGIEKITEVQKADGSWSAPADKLITHFQLGGDWETLYTGGSENELYPLIFRNGKVFAAAADSMTGTLGDVLGETLFDFYGAERNEPLKFLRLEDVHPKSDPVQLKAIGDYLAEQGIPYAVTVIPVYLNPETKEEVKLSDEPQIAHVLKEMQANGASIILHGYRHQYRDSETGEGFEYWDVENDRPVYQGKDEPVQLRNDFETEEEFKAYIKKGQTFEQDYIASTIKRGVRELAEQELYPLAFEAPHYSMSQAGYQLLAEHFSTYVGEIQTSDHTYNGTHISLFDTAPGKLNGMKVLPETLGYIDPDNPDAVAELIDRAEYTADFADSYLAFFYHPYLGLEGLKEVLAGMEQFNNYAWLDMKQLDNRIEIDGLTIKSEDGHIAASRSMAVLVTETAKSMWWFAVPLLVVLMIITLSIRKKFVRKTEWKNKAI